MFIRNTLFNFFADMRRNIILIIALVAIGILGRVIPHPYNFTPMTAIALLSAHAFKNKWVAIGIPLISFWMSDIIINNFIYAGYYENFRIFSPGVLWIYGSIACIALMGKFSLNKVSATKIGLSSIAGSTIFFILTNFGVWAISGMYAKSFIGLTQCYALAIPFFGGAILGDLLYSAILFSTYSFALSKQAMFNKANNFI